MPKTPVLTARKVEKILKKHGFIVKRQTGSHCTFHQSETHKTTVVPIHSGDLAIGTLKSIIKQAGLTVKDFSK